MVWGWEGGPLERAPAAVAGLRGVLPGAVLLVLAPRVLGGPRACFRRPALGVWVGLGVGGGGLGWAAG